MTIEGLRRKLTESIADQNVDVQEIQTALQESDGSSASRAEIKRFMDTYSAQIPERVRTILTGELARPALVTPSAPASPTTPSSMVSRRDGAKIAAGLSDFQSVAAAGAPVVPTPLIDEVVAQAGDALTADRASTWLTDEGRDYPGAELGPLLSQLAWASLVKQDRSAAAALTHNSTDLVGAFAALSASIVVDPVTNEAQVPQALARFYDTYMAPRGSGVDLTQARELWLNARQRVEQRGGAETLVLWDLILPQPNGWSFTMSNGELLVQREGPGASAPMRAGDLDRETLRQLKEGVQSGSLFCNLVKRKLGEAHDAVLRVDLDVRRAAMTRISGLLRSAVDRAQSERGKRGERGASAYDAGLHDTAAIEWETERALADRRLDHTDVMRLVGAATEHPGAESIRGVLDAVRKLSSWEEGSLDVTDGLLLGSAVPYAALGVTDSRVASAFAPTPARTPHEGTPLKLDDLKALLAQAGLTGVRPEALMFALHKRDVAFTNNKVLDGLGEKRLTVQWGYREAWMVTKGQHTMDGYRDQMAPEALQKREVDYFYQLGDMNLANGPFNTDHLEASRAGDLISGVPGLKKLENPIAVLAGTVPSPPPEVWATALNPLSYDGRRILQISELLDRVDQQGPIQTPAGAITRDSLLASIPDVLSRFGPRTALNPFEGRVRTDQYDAVRQTKGVFARAVDLQKRMRAATTPEENAAFRAALAADTPAAKAMGTFPYGNFENEIDRYCTFGGAAQGYGEGESGADDDPMLNKLGTVTLASLKEPWRDVNFLLRVHWLPRSETVLNFRRPITESWASRSIGAWPLSANAGESVVATGSSTGAIARRGKDTFYLSDGHLFLGDQPLAPRGNPLLDKVKVLVANDFLVFALDDAGALPYRGLGNPPGISDDVKRRYQRGTWLFHVPTQTWTNQQTFNMAAVGEARLVPETSNFVPPRLVPASGGLAELILDTRYGNRE